MKIDDTIKQLNGRVYELTKADMGRQSVIKLMYIKASSVNSTFEPLEKRSPVALAEDNIQKVTLEIKSFFRNKYGILRSKQLKESIE